MSLINEIEVIYKKDNDTGLPEIIRNGITYYLGGSAKALYASAYDEFFGAVNHTIETQKNIVIDFKIGYYNSKANQMLKVLFSLLNANYFRCKPTVNWYYFEDDLYMQEACEDHIEDYPNIEFNSLILKD